MTGRGKITRITPSPRPVHQEAVQIAHSTCVYPASTVLDLTHRSTDEGATR